MDSLPRSESPDGVSFLTSLLVHYPQVGSAQIRDGGRTLSLEFFLNRPLRTAQLREFSRDLKEAHEVFGLLKGVEPALVKVQRTDSSRSISQESSFESMEEDWQDRMDSFLIVRDLGTVTGEELSLLVALVEEEFARELVVGEDFEDAVDDDEGYQEEILHQSLDRLRHGARGLDLIGFRDDMRVLVYPAEEAGPKRRS